MRARSGQTASSNVCYRCFASMRGVLHEEFTRRGLTLTPCNAAAFWPGPCCRAVFRHWGCRLANSRDVGHGGFYFRPRSGSRSITRAGCYGRPRRAFLQLLQRLGLSNVKAAYEPRPTLVVDQRFDFRTLTALTHCGRAEAG
jgi:hypothetical protein